MITNITLENFKCFRHVSINPKLLTVLIGPNGTGKSSVLQALLLQKQSVGTDKIQFQGEFINFAGSSDLIPGFLSDEPVMHIAFAGREKGSDVSYQGRFSSQLEPLYRGILPPSFSPIAVPLKNLEFVQAARGFVSPSYPLGNEPSEKISLTDGLSNLEERLATNLVYNAPIEQTFCPNAKRVTGVGLRLDTKMIPGRKVEVKSLIPQQEL